MLGFGKTYFVFWVDEAIIESFPRLSKVKEVIDSFSCIQTLRRGHLTHASKLHFGDVHADGRHLVHIVLLLSGEAKDVKGLVHDQHLLGVIDGLNQDLAHGDERVVKDVVRETSLLVEINRVGDHEVEDMVRPLTGGLVGHTGLFQKVNLDISSGHLAHVVKPNTDELSEPGGVVVPHSLGIAVGLKDGVGLDDLVLKRSLLFLSLLHLLRAARADKGEVGDDLLGVLSLSGSRLSGNQNGLILTL